MIAGKKAMWKVDKTYVMIQTNVCRQLVHATTVSMTYSAQTRGEKKRWTRITFCFAPFSFITSSSFSKVGESA